MTNTILSLLRALRLNPVQTEAEICVAIGNALSPRLPYRREERIGPRCRIDFLCAGGVGIEVKRGKPNSSRLAAQAKRYCGCDPVKALILVVERNVWDCPRAICGKPVHLVSLTAQWGVST